MFIQDSLSSHYITKIEIVKSPWEPLNTKCPIFSFSGLIINFGAFDVILWMEIMKNKVNTDDRYLDLYQTLKIVSHNNPL